MSKITITRALSELKTLDHRIEKLIQELVPYAFTVGGKINTSQYKDVKQAEEEIKSDYQSITDLIKRKMTLRNKIDESNSVTKITISNKEITVIEAIKYKNIIDLEKQLLQQLRKSNQQAISSIERSKNQLDEKIQKNVEINLGKDSKVKTEEYEAIAKAIQARYEAKLIDPLNMNKLIKDKDKELSDFETEVDFILSESNARTEIEI